MRSPSYLPDGPARPSSGPPLTLPLGPLRAADSTTHCRPARLQAAVPDPMAILLAFETTSGGSGGVEEVLEPVDCLYIPLLLLE
jgi:hypothetical protein